MSQQSLWRVLVTPRRSKRANVLDLVVGVVLPLMCVGVDPIVFQRGIPGDSSEDPALLEEIQTFAYGGMALEICMLLIWLIARPDFRRRFGAVFAGAFSVGALASVLLGIRLLPLSFIGLFFF
ncbi:MAG: hypothetical protein AAF517_18730, partial [Planctomycetota bacterium]